MNKRVISVAISFAALAFAASAGADERLVSFDGGIGVIPVSNGVVPQGAPATTLTVEVVTRNVVRNTPPGGQPWVIERLKADVRTDGSIKVDGRGLLLAGSNNIGTNGGQSVRARLFCGSDVQHNSGLVPLDADGDFRIQSELDPVPPNPCNNPILLIVSGGGNWFAAGIPKR
jgi:hypothetical protein